MEFLKSTSLNQVLTLLGGCAVIWMGVHYDHLSVAGAIGSAVIFFKAFQTPPLTTPTVGGDK